MEITEAQYRRIEDCLPRQRGNESISNLQVPNAIPYVAENGCKWRGLPHGQAPDGLKSRVSNSHGIGAQSQGRPGFPVQGSEAHVRHQEGGFRGGGV